MKSLERFKNLPARMRVLAALPVLGLVGLSLAFSGNDKGAQQAATPVPGMTVNVVAPVRTTFARAIAAAGTVNARDELIIGSDAAGVRLLEVLADVGSAVRQGQLLARADDAQLRAQYAQQQALIKQARAELAQARANLERAELLRDSGVYSVETLQARRTAAAAASAKHELAQAQRLELEVKLAQTRVTAPADGVIVGKSATVGAVVQPGMELFRLIRDGAVEWQAELPGHSLARVRPGAPSRILLNDGAVIEGVVRLVAPTMDADTRNGLVYVSLPQDAPLRAGGHAQGEIIVDNVQALALPEASVLTRDGYPFVYLVGDDQIARLARVETGTRQRGLVEIVAGIDGGARVIGTGAGFVKDGDLVTVVPEAGRQVVAQLGGNN